MTAGRSGRRQIPPQDVARFWQARASGMSIKDAAKIAGVHPYDFRWKMNPVAFGGQRGLSDYQMKCMMGHRVFSNMRGY